MEPKIIDILELPASEQIPCDQLKHFMEVGLKALEEKKMSEATIKQLEENLSIYSMKLAMREQQIEKLEGEMTRLYGENLRVRRQYDDLRFDRTHT